MRTTVPRHSGPAERDRAARQAAARAVVEAASEAWAGPPSRRDPHRAWLHVPSLPLLPGVHEWFDAPPDGEPGDPRCGVGSARRADPLHLPPLAILIDLAWRAILQRDQAGEGAMVLWIGSRCRPYPHALVRRDPSNPHGPGDRRLLERSIFVEAAGAAERVWAIDLALRCAAVAAVIADGRALSMADSRRLQIAAAAGGAPAWLARPARERGELSAARTRWLVAPEPSLTSQQTWRVELLRCKGGQPAPGSARLWAVRRDDATGRIHEWAARDGDLAPRLADRPPAPARSKIA